MPRIAARLIMSRPDIRRGGEIISCLAHFLVEERYLFRTVAASEIDIPRRWQTPHQFLFSRHFKDLPAVCVNNQRVPVIKALRHPAFECVKGKVQLAGEGPGERLRLRIVLQNTRCRSTKPLIIEDEQVAVVEKAWIVLGMPGALSRPDDGLGIRIDNGDNVGRSEEHTA